MGRSVPTTMGNGFNHMGIFCSYSITANKECLHGPWALSCFEYLLHIHSLIGTEKCEMSAPHCKLLTIYPFKFGTAILLMGRDISVIDSRSLFNLKSWNYPQLSCHSHHIPSITQGFWCCPLQSFSSPWSSILTPTTLVWTFLVYSLQLTLHYSFNWIPCL